MTDKGQHKEGAKVSEKMKNIKNRDERKRKGAEKRGYGRDKKQNGGWGEK
jgi:hypothetical protein